jgi:uncharacterized repeat protein (TIGR01451 family)
MTRAILLSVVVLVASGVAVRAQQQNGGSGYRSALGSRLDAFRRNILGEPVPERPQPKPHAAAHTTNQTQQSTSKASPNRSNSRPDYMLSAAARNGSNGSSSSSRKLFTPAPPAEASGAGFATSNELAVEENPAMAPENAPRPSHRRVAKESIETSSPIEREVVATRSPPAVVDRSSDDDVVAPVVPRVMSSNRRAQAKPTTVPRVARMEKLAPTETDDVAPTSRSSDDSPAADGLDGGDRLFIVRKSPNIGVETAGPRRITIGKEATFVVTLNNTGDLAANDVVVFVSVPEWAEVTGARASTGTTGSASGNQADGYQWKIATLPARSQQELALKIVPRKSQPFQLGVRWTCSPTSSEATVEVQEPKLQMAITGPAEVVFGQQQIYKLTITNPGTGDADDCTIHLIPITPGEGTAASHRVGTLAAGASKSVEIELTARQAGRLVIKAEATADGDLKANASEEVFVRRAGLEIVLAGPKVHYAGAPALYEVRVKNPGDAPAQNVNVVAALPSEVELLAASHSGHHEPSRGEVTWTVDQLAAGSEQVFTVKCALKTTGINRVEALATADGDLKDTALVNTQVMALADLVLDVTDTPGPIPVGQDMTYEVRIRNRGSNSAEGVDVVAYFSEGVEPIAVDGGNHELNAGTVLFKPIASLAAGDETVYKIKARASVPGNHRIRVELQCKSLGTRLTRDDTTLFYGDDGLNISTGSSTDR